MNKKNRSRRVLAVESLENRIAPALLVLGANLLGGAGNPTTGETSIGDNTVTIIKVVSGEAIAWFDGDQHITAISVGPNTSLELAGNVGEGTGDKNFTYGDIVANLTASGRLSDSDNNPLNGEDGGVLLPNNIVGIKTSPVGHESGGIGNIITGGSVSNLSINGWLRGVYAGDGAYRTDPGDGNLPVIPARPLIGPATIGVDLFGIDSDPLTLGSQSGFTLDKANAVMQAGAAIKNVTVQVAYQTQMFAGDGSPMGTIATGAGAAGGTIDGIKIVQSWAISPSDEIPDVNGHASYHLYAGDGGSGSSGGSGGSISHITDVGSTGTALMRAGAGGNGSTGAGGAGGSVTLLDLQTGGTGYTLTAGAGGQGSPGGAGGSVTLVNSPKNDPNPGIVVTADFNHDGLQDLILIDQNTGKMVVELNNGNGGYDAVHQDESTAGPIYTINGLGSTPVAAVADDINTRAERILAMEADSLMSASIDPQPAPLILMQTFPSALDLTQGF